MNQFGGEQTMRLNVSGTDRARSRRAPGALLIVENVSLARDHRLRKQVDTLLALGWRVSVICRADSANRHATTAQVYQYPAPRDARSKLGFVLEYGYSVLAAAVLTARVAVSQRLDTVQVAGNPDIYFPLTAPLRAIGTRVVFDQRDLAPETYTARYGTRGGPVVRALRWLERASYRCADHVLVVNESLRAVATGRGGVAEDRVTVVGNGPRLTGAGGHPPVPALRRGRRHMVLWLGMMGPQDSLELMVRAVDRLVRGHGRTDTLFVLAGEGDARPEAERLAAALGVTDWVQFTGWLDQHRAAAYLATADVGIETNLAEFVSPVKIMEYMGAALPVAAFDLAETRGLSDGSALLAPPGDVDKLARNIQRLLDDPELRAELGRRGRKRVNEGLAWEHQARAYERVLAAASGRRRPPTPTRRPAR